MREPAMPFKCPSGFCQKKLTLVATKRGGWTGYCPDCNIRIFYTPRDKALRPDPEMIQEAIGSSESD